MFHNTLVVGSSIRKPGKSSKTAKLPAIWIGVRPGELVGHQPCSITLWLLVRVRPAPPRSRAFWRLLRSGGQPIIIENVGGAGRCRGIRALTGHTTSEQDDWRARQTDEVCRSLAKAKGRISLTNG